jgi:mannonate dehydratase
MAASLHLDIAINNFGVQEHMLHPPQAEEVFPHAYVFREGAMVPGDEPGLGVDINEEVAARYPYQRAYLPVNRKEDGTLFHW